MKETNSNFVTLIKEKKVIEKLREKYSEVASANIWDYIANDGDVFEACSATNDSNDLLLDFNSIFDLFCEFTLYHFNYHFKCSYKNIDELNSDRCNGKLNKIDIISVCEGSIVVFNI